VYALLIALAVTSLGSIPGQAAPPPDHILTGQTLDVVAHGQAKQIGHHKADDVLTLHIGQAVHDSVTLDAFIAAVTDKHNPLYGHYLTAAQYKARFAPTDQEVQVVRDWVTGAGLTVTAVSPDNLLVSIQGTTTQIEQALKVTINDYQRDDGSTFRSNDRDATVPGGVNIQAISGLSTYERAVTNRAPRDLHNVGGINGYTPNDFRTAYNMNAVGSTASGQRIGLILWGGKVVQSDLHVFAGATGTPELVAGLSGDNGIDWIGVDGNPMTDATPGTIAETAQDVEYGHGVAPGSHLKFWLAPCAPGGCGSGDNMGLEDAISAAANDPDVHIVSNSWNFGGPVSDGSLFININTSLQRAVAGGTTFYFASGDYGRNSQPAFPSTSPYVVAVGGTTLKTNSNQTYGSETAWSSGKLGSGGGCDPNISRPSWQTGVTATNNGAPCAGRAIPDVAADADPATPGIQYFQGHYDIADGTSLSTPLWAGMTADIDFALGTGAAFLVGFAGPELYRIGSDPNAYPYDMHDITITPSGGPAYNAVKGWDEATGLGSPDANQLYTQFIVYGDAPLSTYAGTGSLGCSGDGGQAAQALLNQPYGLTASRDGSVYLLDSFCNTVRQIVAAGTIVTVAGTGTPGVGGYSGDGGPANAAHLNSPKGIAVDVNYNLYIADTGNNVIREVTNGVIRTIAGTGTKGYNGDGKATSSQLNGPMSVAVDASTGLLYIADSGNNLIRVIDSSGNMITVAGKPGVVGFSGDGGPAASATLNAPQGVAVSQGNVYIADTNNNRVRIIVKGNITTYVGTGVQGDTNPNGYSVLAVNAQIDHPIDLLVDSFGNLYFTEGSNRVRQVDTSGPYTYIVVGTGTCGKAGTGGPASQAQLCGPAGIAFDKGQSQLFIADVRNARVMRMTIAH